MYTEWLNRLSGMSSPRVLEIGTKAWDGKPSRHHRSDILTANPMSIWDGLDTEPGEDVTIVSDIHSVSEIVPADTFDMLLCPSVLEHLRRPWVAARQLASISKVGAMLLVNTHQSFPYHPYPKDYYRFSIEGLEEVFAPDAGWKVVRSEYQFPCQVTPKTNVFAHAQDWNFEAQAWLNVSCIAERVKHG
jgi:hypothetical protein